MVSPYVIAWVSAGINYSIATRRGKVTDSVSFTSSSSGPSFVPRNQHTFFISPSLRRRASAPSIFDHSRADSKHVVLQPHASYDMEDIYITSETSVQRSIVWFRVGDMRVRDHPGLFRAGETTRESIVPLFIVTPDTPWNNVVHTLHALRTSLRARRAELVVRFAASERQGLLDFIQSEYPCDAVHVRYDVQSEVLEMFEWLGQRLNVPASASCQTVSPHGNELCYFVFWRDDLRDFPGDRHSWLTSMPSTYPRFLRWDVRNKSRVLTSTVEFEPEVMVPGIPRDAVLEPGNLDSIGVLHRNSLKRPSADKILASFRNDSQRLNVEDFETMIAKTAPGEDAGEMIVTRLLERLEQYEAVDIARSLEPVMQLGLVSQRRIYEIVLAFERLNGRLFRPIYRSGAKKILSWLDAREFANCLAERDLADPTVTVDGHHRPKFWRWRGTLIRYVEEGAHLAQDIPAVLLVHGFGASAQHWGRTMCELREKFHVFAVCLPGFGRAEKPPFVYTQDLWESFIAEFVSDVIGKSVFVVGNSIGGYLSCAFASDGYPDLCAGLTLVNTAGPLLPPDEYELQLQSSVDPDKNSSVLSWLLQNFEFARHYLSRMLLIYLRRNISSTLRRTYPTADPSSYVELLEEIYRNSLDPGAVNVLSSGFILPKPRPINALLAVYDGPMLVVQGELDIIGNPLRRAELLKAVFPSAKIVVVNAGHCPHDESPVVFNKALVEWIEDALKYQSADVSEQVTDGVNSVACDSL